MGLDMFKHMGHQLVPLNHVLDNRYFIKKSLNFRIQFGVVCCVCSAPAAQSIGTVACHSSPAVTLSMVNCLREVFVSNPSVSHQSQVPSSLQQLQILPTLCHTAMLCAAGVFAIVRPVTCLCWCLNSHSTVMPRHFTSHLITARLYVTIFK